MVSYEVGRVCMKITGREAGRYCVVVKKVSNAFVEVTGPKLLTGVKRRKANIAHLEATQYIVEIPENAADELVIEGFQKANLMTRLGLKKPSAAEMKAEKTKAPKEVKVEKKSEEKSKEEKETKEKKSKKK